MNKDTKISVLLDLYGKVLSETQFQSMDFYYNQDLSLSEISYHTGMSRQGVYDCIKRSESILSKMEDSLGLLKKLSLVNKNLKQISDLASDIRLISKNQEVKEKANCIEKIADETNYKI